MVPDGGYFDNTVVSQLSFSVLPSLGLWTSRGPTKRRWWSILRSLLPLSQGSSNFGGGLEDAGPDDGGSNASDDAGPAGTTSATCGATTCTAGDVCCVLPSDKTDAGLVGSCGAASSCTGFALSCTYTGDCPAGQVCCGDLGGSPATASCQTSCPSTDDQLCKTVGECPAGDGCRAYAFGDGIKVCLEKANDGGKAANDGGKGGKDGGKGASDAGSDGGP